MMMMIKITAAMLYNTYKDLGIIISSDLSFNEHYRYITAQAFRVLGLLRRTFSESMNIREKKVLYISLVRSQLLFVRFSGDLI